VKWNARSSLACEIGILWGLNGTQWSEKPDSAIRSTLAAGGACRQEGLRGLRFGRSGRSCGAARRSNSGWAAVEAWVPARERSGGQVDKGRGREGATARVSRRLWNGCGLAAPLSFVGTGENGEQA
jgi:hypothetical protein